MMCDDDSDGKAVCLARLAKIVKRDIFFNAGYANFTGAFDEYPHSLLALVDVIYKWS